MCPSSRRVKTVALCSILVALVAPAGTAAPVLYVSPSGNDVWTGLAAEPNAEKTDGPFSTLERARDELRALREGGADVSGAIVYVRGGEYFLEQPFSLTAIDSGSEDNPVRYLAYGEEKPILVGGAQLKGFKPYKGKIMSLDLASVGREGMTFGQLFYDGKRQVLARYPNYDHGNPYAGGFLYAAEKATENAKQRLCYNDGELREWARPTDGQVWVFPGTNYWNNIVSIESIDREKRLIALTQPCSYEINKGDRYFVRGLFEELDAPGEWYLDKEKSILYFWPPGEISRRISAPVVGTVVEITHDAKGERPHDIWLQGFTIEGCDGAAVRFSNARRCTIAKSTIRNAGSGVSVSTAVDCLVIGNDIYQTGSSGVTVYSGNRNPTSPDGNRVENNYIHHTGYFSKTSSAIGIGGVGNKMSHNLIHDCPRIAISYNGNDHIIEYNHLRHMNLETQDSGATYCLGRDWTNRGHVVRYNYVHDTLGYGRHGGTKWETPFFTFGIYLDDWSSGQHVYGNVVARSFLAGIDVHSGRDNVIENNIIYDCAKEQMRYQLWPTTHTMLPDMHKAVQDWPYSHLYTGLARHKDAREDATQSYNLFQRNVISYGRPGSYCYAVSGLDYATTDHDYNIIWKWDGQPDSSLDKMRENGLDRNSVVADPMLVDPANGDFRLKPDSPALKMGFEQIPFDEIGCYASPYRASWPIVEAEGAREHPHQQVKLPPPILPKFSVAKAGAPITIDGKLDAREWGGLDRGKAMVLAQDPAGNKGVEPKSHAWLAHDEEALYVGLLNELKPGTAPSGNNAWGGSDGAEVCLQVVQGTNEGQILVLQGFASGYFQSTDHAGALAKTVEAIGKATSFAATAGESQWFGEWRIPLAEAGIDPATATQIRFNIGVRKTAGPASWVVWIGTGSSNWRLDNAGQIVFE